MANITITIPDAIAQRVLDGMVPVVPLDAQGNPVGTKAQLAKAMLIDYIKTTVRNAESEAAKTAAAQTADSQITLS